MLSGTLKVAQKGVRAKVSTWGSNILSWAPISAQGCEAKMDTKKHVARHPRKFKWSHTQYNASYGPKGMGPIKQGIVLARICTVL